MDEINIFQKYDVFCNSKFSKDLEEFELSFLFYVEGDKKKDSLQIGYFNEKENLVKNFEITTNNEIKFIEESEPAVKEKEFFPLYLDRVTFDLNQVVAISKKAFLENTKQKEQVFKIFYLLRNTNKGIVWLCNFITASFKVINVTICAESGTILEFKEDQVFDFSLGNTSS